MKRLLYIAFKDFSSLHFGANAKVLSQCRAFEEYGYDVDLLGRENSCPVLIKTDKTTQKISDKKVLIKNKRLRNMLDKRNQMKILCDFIKDKSYDVCYIRYDFSTPGFISLLKELKKVCSKIFLELPTYPYEEENKYGILSKSKIFIDAIYRKKIHKYIDYIVTFYEGYSELFGIPVIVVPNGFDFSTMTLAESDLPDDEIHIVAVSSMREWHGYERIIEGFKNYYSSASDGKYNFILHLVGNGREYGKYENLVKSYHLEDRIILEGAMFGEKLNALYEKCALGIDSLARHRSGIEVLSSLKSREYGAKGIPLINSCKIDILDDDFPYLLRVPANEEPVDMNSISAFYDKCYHSGKSRQEIGTEIRSYMESRSGMKETFRKVVERFRA